VSDESILCYCFGVTREQVRRHFADPRATLEQLIERTSVTRKCTACLVDLDMLIDGLGGASDRGSAEKGATDQADSAGWADVVDRIDSGFFLSSSEVRTSIRLANYPPVDAAFDCCVTHDWTLRAYSEGGALLAVLRGSVAPHAEATIALADIGRLPERGWFLLRQVPAGEGHYGTLRPQVLLTGRNWAAAYHTQFHADATRKGRRAGIPVFVVDGHTNAQISIINGTGRPTRFSVRIDGAGGSRSVDGRLPGNGSTLFDLDAAFAGVCGSGAAIVRVESDEPTRKNIVNRHPDGTLGVEHFPNVA
jgi:bacterioferritin-associated ferredoxin